MKPAPPNWPRLSSALYYEDAASAIDWLCRAFGFEVRMDIRDEDGHVVHSELTYGEALIMISESAQREKYPYRRAPREVDGVNTQNLMIYVDDVEAHFTQARAAGAVIHRELETVDYGDEYWSDRGYECEDCGGHHWWFYQRLRDPLPKG